MICKKCGVAMETGTSYEGNGRWKRYRECPKCHERIFINDQNIQENYASEKQKVNNF